MALNKKITINYRIVNSLTEFTDGQKKLIESTISICPNAYAPYSNFQVGAGILLDSNEILTGTNIENAASPIGICAERNVISHFLSHRANRKIKTIAIHAFNQHKATAQMVSPCGMCRQTILETEINQEQDIEIILIGNKSKFIVFDSAKMLLPMAFTPEHL